MLHRTIFAVLMMISVTGLGSLQAQSLYGGGGIPSSGSWADIFVDRLELGTRITWFSLTDDSTAANNSFLGTINQLEDEQDLMPYKIFANVILHEYVSVELSFDKIEAATRTTDGKSDGDVTMGGPILSVMGRYPLGNGVVPYAGIGLAFFGADFDESTHWGQGYADPADWRRSGSPSTPKNGVTRRMNVDDDTGFVLTAGASYAFYENWSVDAFIRWMDVEADAVFVRRVNGQETLRVPGNFPMENIGMGVGVKYSF